MFLKFATFRRKLSALTTLITLAAVGAPVPTAAQPPSQPYLVKDIHRNVALGNGSNPLRMTAVGKTVFFLATTPSCGTELWKSDGTAAGTVLVKDIWPGVNSGLNAFSPPDLVNVNGTLYFAASDGTHGTELWKSDGTATGTVMVKDIGSGLPNANPQDLTWLNGSLYFISAEGAYGKKLWKSNGVTAENTLVTINSGTTATLAVSKLFSMNGSLYFIGDVGHGVGLWKTNGTPSETTLVQAIPALPYYACGVTVINNSAYITVQSKSDQISLWKSDGTPSGTFVLRTSQSSPTGFVSLKGKVYFVGQEPQHGMELWVTDGTTSGTTMIMNQTVNSQGNGGIFAVSTNKGQPLVVLGDTLLFAGASAKYENWRHQTDGFELWKSDGTTSGTVMVKNINPGTYLIDGTSNIVGNDSNPKYLTVIGGKVYFSANDGTHGEELWVSDGTTSGTVMVKDASPGAGSLALQGPIIDVAGTAYFPADDGYRGAELWKSNGTAAGTDIVKSICLGNDSNPASMVAVGDDLYFTARDLEHGREVWKSDGTASGTTRVTDIGPGTANMMPDIDENSSILHDLKIITINKSIYFALDFALWKVDGATGGAEMVKNTLPHASLSGVSILNNSAVLNSKIYFTGVDLNHGAELWVSDGTTTGTTMLKDINPGNMEADLLYPRSSSPREIVSMNGKIYFSALTGEDLKRVGIYKALNLWASDGTSTGTVMVKDVIYPQGLTNVNGTLFFSAQVGDNWNTLWKSDGTSTGTVMVKSFSGKTSQYPVGLTNVNGKLFFVDSDNNGYKLWTSDGTEAGTVIVKDLDSRPYQLVAVGSAVYFVTTDGVHGAELWKSDGTAAGTVMVKDINPGELGSYPYSLTNVNGMLYFSAYDPEHGDELWRSDGTAAGTLCVGDITPGPPGSVPQNLTVVGDTLYFSAINEASDQGRELWALKLTNGGKNAVRGWQRYAE